MVKKNLFLKPNRKLIYGAGIFSTISLLSGNFLFSTSSIYLIPLVIFYSLTALYLFTGYLVGVSSKSFSARKHNSILLKYKATGRVLGEVDVFLPVCGEDINVIRNTWNGVRDMIGLKKVFVLDDKKSKEVEALAGEFGFHYITRKDNSLKKAGNLRNAFVRTSSPFIVILDADFRPHKEFLYHTLPYFDDDKIAIVQTPQFFQVKKDNSWIKNAAGSVQELFYRLIQVNRDYYGGAICVGTNAVYRRAALEPFGGTYAIEYSEDVHTGFQLLSTGWKIKYIPVILAEGECPDTIKQFFTQQYRWSMGSISLMFSEKFWKAKITLMQRLCYMTGMFYYVTTGLSVLVGFMPQTIMLAFFPDKIYWYNLLFSVPSFVFSFFIMKLWMKTPMTMDLIRVRHISYYAHLFALKDYLMNTLEEWKPTGASYSSIRFENFKVMFEIMMIIPFMVNLSLIVWRMTQGFDPVHFSLSAFFLFFYYWLNLKIYEELYAK